MQISVDNNARPHNQQIINSPPPTSYSTRQFHMWKKVLMHAAKHQTTSMLLKSVIDYSVKEPHISNSQSFEKPVEMWPWHSKVYMPDALRVERPGGNAAVVK